jgi:predicted metal-binding membrane protein
VVKHARRGREVPINVWSGASGHPRPGLSPESDESSGGRSRLSTLGVIGVIVRPASVRSELTAGPAGLAVLGATLGIAIASWVISALQMGGMNMGIATPLGSFPPFLGIWVAMMAAMMLPGAAPAVLRRTRTAGSIRVVPGFLVAYLGMWTLFGVAVYALDRPHGAVVAGAITVAAGLYELTPVKQQFRRRCRERTCSGLGFGLDCIGSSIGWMLVLVAMGVMSLVWMAVIAVPILVQKLLPAKAAIDLPVALATVVLGVLIFVDPSLVPGLMPPM